jgi:hypothetical protein
MDKVKFVVASRENEADFHTKTATGRSLGLYNFSFLDVRVFPSNVLGLPKIYNAIIQESVDDPCILIFAHDDLHITDYFWMNSILNGLQNFQVIGLAGNKRRVPRQPSWLFIDENLTMDNADNLSGVVGHGTGFPPDVLSMYGPPRQHVKLLDGMLIAVHSRTLTAASLRFDEIFDFHFYDLDFCRQAEQKSVTCGTCALSVIHESMGSLKSQAWKDGYAVYMKKWGE